MSYIYGLYDAYINNTNSQAYTTISRDIEINRVYNYTIPNKDLSWGNLIKIRIFIKYNNITNAQVNIKYIIKNLAEDNNHYIITDLENRINTFDSRISENTNNLNTFDSRISENTNNLNTLYKEGYLNYNIIQTSKNNTDIEFQFEASKQYLLIIKYIKMGNTEIPIDKCIPYCLTQAYLDGGNMTSETVYNIKHGTLFNINEDNIFSKTFILNNSNFICFRFHLFDVPSGIREIKYYLDTLENYYNDYNNNKGLFQILSDDVSNIKYDIRGCNSLFDNYRNSGSNQYNTINYDNIHLPYEIRYIEELPVSLYKNSMIINNNGNIYISGTNGITHIVEELDTTNFKSGSYMIFIDNMEMSENEIGRPINVVCKSSNDIINKFPKIICMGDSLTNRNIATNTKLNLANIGVTGTFIGTMNNGSDHGEGREGWTYMHFIGSDTTYQSSEILPQTTAGISSLTLCPFLKVASAQDKQNHPNWCFTHTSGGVNKETSYADASDIEQDFYIFDFNYYLSTQGFNDPDIVTIALSRNDVGQYSSTYLTDNSLALEIICRQIKSACPNCKIVIIPAPVQPNLNNSTASIYERLMNWHEQVIKLYNTTLSDLNDIYILSIHAFMPRKFIFGRTNTFDAEIYANTNLIKYTVADTTHWDNSGKYMYGRVLASYIGTLL